MLDHKKDRKAWLYLALPLIVLGVFTFFPIINTLLISIFAQYDPISQNFGGYVNFQAYVEAFTHPHIRRIFLTALTNTVLIGVFTVPITVMLALLIAVFLNSIKPFQKVFQMIFFIPYVTNTLAIGMVFAVIFAQPAVPVIWNEYGEAIGGGFGQGIVNSLLRSNINWVNNAAPRHNWIMVVVIYQVWNGLAFRILVFIGGLQSIGKQYYDAAKIDSAPPGRVLRKITIPLLSPIIAFVVTTSVISAFQTSESVLAVAGGAGGAGGVVPALQERWTFVHLIYDFVIGDLPHLNSNNVSNYSIGAALAVILMLIILAATALNLWVSSKRVHF